MTVVTRGDFPHVHRQRAPRLASYSVGSYLGRQRNTVERSNQNKGLSDGPVFHIYHHRACTLLQQPNKL